MYPGQDQPVETASKGKYIVVVYNMESGMRRHANFWWVGQHIMITEIESDKAAFDMRPLRAKT